MNFLLEIGVEEIPDWMIPGALADLKKRFEVLFTGAVTKVDATARRLTVRCLDVPERQNDLVTTRQGPKVGSNPAAVSGFAKKWGLQPGDLHISDDRYVYIEKVQGLETKSMLAETLPDQIASIPWPKTMYWTAKSGFRFIRPIRWVVALLGDEVVPFEIAGVRSGNASSGHRRLGAAKFPVTIDNYEQKLRENFVLLSAEERRARIRAVGIKYKCDTALLETLTYLTEWPTPIIGEFDPSYLTLPKEVLSTVMRHHQKYFSVENDDGTLAPKFVAAMNIDSDAEGIVKRGNERVLRARFNDARFFWDADQKKKLADRVSDLANVTFQAKLGSYLEKTKRVMTLVEQLGGDAFAVRAAELAKCDLTTELVKEFTELQGQIGGLYARAQGEPEEVAAAIYDQYKPVSMEDSIPNTHSGRLLSLADKLDTLIGCFSVGMIPTGSKDPFALRRAAQGIVKILVESSMELPLVSLLGGTADLIAFFEDRVRFYFKDIRNFKYDEVNAAMAIGWGNLVDLERRLIRIQAIRPTPDFEPIAASFKRIKNILRQANFEESEVEEQLLEPGPERDLYERAGSVAGQPIEQAIAVLRPRIDLFFDKVMVNSPDPAIRQNRLSLLSKLLREFSTIADFSEIITSS